MVAAENYSRLCKIVTDLSTLPLTTRQNPTGETYYRADYDIVLSFGLTELKAQVAWQDENVRLFPFLQNLNIPSLAFFFVDLRIVGS